MKKIITLLTLLLALNTYAIQSSVDLLSYTLAQLIQTTALTAASVEMTTAATNIKHIQALKIQNDIQSFYQTGKISPFLNEKIEQSLAVNPELSLNESLDLLLEAAAILNI